MEAANPPKSTRTPATAGAGELILQNGRQAGARRPLTTPTTFVGRNQSCDLRLNVDGVAAMHCVLAAGPDGWQLRDLNSINGTYVNGQRVESVRLQDGDLLNVGPFQFRVELANALAPPAGVEDEETQREALRIQAAAVAAQQAALEEEEARLQQRRSDLKQQEEQLAAHLAEKQRQVQLWSEYTKSERETLRKEKTEQEKHLSTIEQELLQAKQANSKEQQDLLQERQRVGKVYQRLRQRWQRQWAAEKEKHQKQALKLQAETATLESRQQTQRTREATHAQEVERFHTERELGMRRLKEERRGLDEAQQSWRRRRSHDCSALKAKERELAETLAKLHEARQLLVQDTANWDAQQESLQKELHGLNNRSVHQRRRIQEQEEEIARLDGVLRERRLQLGQLPTVELEAGAVSFEPEPIECEVEVVADSAAPAETAAWHDRFAGLDRLAGELADQRCHLLEQYKRLAEIQDVWQRQRDQAAAELESLAKRLLAEEDSLRQRDQQTVLVEELLHKRRQETDAAGQEMQTDLAQLKAREEAFAHEHQQQMLAVRQREALLGEQLAGIAELRQRWNRRRQQEIDDLRANRALVEQQQKEVNTRRLELFDRGQQVEEDRRTLSEKALALEQYHQEVFLRAKDPAAQQRLERLRRHWLTLHAAQIRMAKDERDAARKELAELEIQTTEWLQQRSQWTQKELTIAEKQALLEEREALLPAHQLHPGQEPDGVEIHGDIEIIADAIFADIGDTAIDRAA